MLGGVGWQLVTEVLRPIRCQETSPNRCRNTPRKIPQWHGLSYTTAEALSPTVHVYCFQTAKNCNFVCQTASGILLHPFQSSKYLIRSVKGATINGVAYEGLAEFIYLGTLISNDNSVEKEIQRLILAGNRTYFAA